jgi:hypothetical protein
MDDMVTNQRLRDWGINVITDRIIGDRGRDVIFAENAFIENINRDRMSSFVTISYGVMDRNMTMNMQVVTLVVGRDTIIRDSSGRPMSFRNLSEGMIVDAAFSAAMTRSIPPQSRAFSISVVREDNQSAFTEGRVMEVNPEYEFFMIGNPFDINSQMRFNVSNSTIIRDRRGRRIRLRELRPGDFVRVEHATFMTMSIPPQTTAFEVQIL